MVALPGVYASGAGSGQQHRADLAVRRFRPDPIPEEYREELGPGMVADATFFHTATGRHHSRGHLVSVTICDGSWLNPRA